MNERRASVHASAHSARATRHAARRSRLLRAVGGQLRAGRRRFQLAPVRAGTGEARACHTASTATSFRISNPARSRSACRRATIRSHEALRVVREVLTDFVTNGRPSRSWKPPSRTSSAALRCASTATDKILNYLAVIGFYRLPLDYLDAFTARVEAVTLGADTGRFPPPYRSGAHGHGRRGRQAGTVAALPPMPDNRVRIIGGAWRSRMHPVSRRGGSASDARSGSRNAVQLAGPGPDRHDVPGSVRRQRRARIRGGLARRARKWSWWSAIAVWRRRWRATRACCSNRSAGRAAGSRAWPMR